MKYKTIFANQPSELDILVNEAIANGWVPAGGVSTLSIPADISDEVKPIYIQAMTLEEEAGKGFIKYSEEV